MKHDPSTSFWLKKQFEATKERDSVNALIDAEALCSGQLILATVLESWYLTSDSFGAKPAL